MPIPRSWILKLPPGLREQAAWVFIGLMVFLVGLSYLAGVTTSAVASTIGDGGLRVWGGFLAVSGAAVTWASWKANPAHEKFALRLLAFAMLAYVGWLTLSVPWQQGAMTILLASILIGVAEIRVGFLKLALDYQPPKRKNRDDAD